MIMSLFLCAVLFASAPVAVPQAASAQPALDGNRLVKLELVADHAAIGAGEKFTLAAKLTIEPKWHIYWQNPGDAGVPTKVEVHAPAGFEIGALRYPVPVREEAEGDLLSYVHTGEAALLVDVVAPADLKPGASVDIAIDASWLVCTSVCLRGSGKASITLATADKSAAPRLAHEKEFAGWRAKLPRPYEDLLAIAGYHDSGFKDRKQPFVVSVPGALALDFYPRVEEPVSLDVMNLELARDAEACTMKLTFAPPAGYDGKRFGFSGVLAVRDSSGERYYELGFGYVGIH
jgi:thiol:disulfide interchange protein DsbD